MKVEEAIVLLAEVCKIYKGTLEEHTALQTALKTVRDFTASYRKAEKDTEIEEVKETE